MTQDKKQSNLVGWLAGYAKHAWVGVLVLVILSFLIVGTQLLEPWPIKILVDSVFGSVPLPAWMSRFSETGQVLVVAGVSLVLLYGLDSVLTLIKNYYRHHLMFKLDYKINSDFFDRVMHLSMGFLDSQRSGDYAFRQNSETGAVSSLLIETANNILQAILTVTGILLIMFRLNFTLSTVAMVAVPLLYITIRLFTRRIDKQATAVENNTSKIFSYTTESIENVELVQSFGKETDQLSGLQKLLRRNFKISLRYVVTSDTFSLINDMIATVAMAVLIFLGARQVVYQELTVGELLVFLTYLSYLYSPLERISSSIGEARTHLAGIRRVYKVFEGTKVVKQHPNPLPLARAAGQISYQRVGFKYDQREILRDISLEIKPGERVAFIGPSGSGKSTLLSLLPRFYEPNEGSILLDGHSIDRYSIEDLRKQFSIVSQDSPLLAGSVAKNIAFSRPNSLASDSEIEAAAKAANADSFIRRLSEGYRTDVGERGNQLSGGQRQRIAIARAFLKNAPILLLDEPTSALDAESEAAVVDALDSLMKNRTTLIVSHNLSALRRVDTVYVIEDGKVAHKTNFEGVTKFKSYIEEKSRQKV